MTLRAADVLPDSLEFLAAVAADKTRIMASPEMSTSNISPTLHTFLLLYIFSNISLPTPHCGHTQSSGRSSNAVPGLILGESPTSGSYTYPHTVHRYFIIVHFFSAAQTYIKRTKNVKSTKNYNSIMLNNYRFGDSYDKNTIN